MSGPAPAVSIVVPTFNRAGVVGRAVRSCAGGSSCAVEVIVVDDGSTDGTRAALEAAFPGAIIEYGTPAGTVSGGPLGPDSRIRYARQANRGAAAARNTGLALAAGEYVKFLDSDDELAPGALAQEVRCAERTGADVVVSGHEARTYRDGREDPSGRRVFPAPHLERGVDDMLLGRSPWTAAALYRTSAVRNLRWESGLLKADDWQWVWTVCLSGASFATLDIVSAYYNGHEGERITGGRDAFFNSTRDRQTILSGVEAALRRRGDLTPERRRLLAQYLYKDSKVICDRGLGEWRTLWNHCRALAPGFTPVESDPAVRPFVCIAGGFLGVWLFVTLRRLARAVGVRRSGDGGDPVAVRR